ncbi:MAG TPA: hypothetical protein VFV23_08925 [Verrucomicrobiae bacterium]|nr:hypothetical protein [Verrucomicrobiae bacterium]
MKDILNLSTAKLKKIIALKGQIERLQAQLQSIAGGSAAVTSAAAPARKRRAMSAEARRKISLAQKARWAKQKGGK